MNLKTTNMTFLNNQIKTRKDILNYIDNLYDHDMIYHFDDDAKDILNSQHKQAFTEEQCILLDKRRDEMYEIDYDLTFDYSSVLLELC